jgi:hypothetical protein
VFDSDSEAFYNQKIAQLEEEQEQLDWLKLIRCISSARALLDARH